MHLPVAYHALLTSTAHGESLLAPDACALAAAWQTPPDDTAAWMELMLRTQRLWKIAAAGQENNAPLIEALAQAQPKHWTDQPDLPCNPGRLKRQAEVLLNQLNPPEGAGLLVNCSYQGRQVAEYALGMAAERGIHCDLMPEDEKFDTTLINALDDTAIMQLAEAQLARQKANGFAMYIRSKDDPTISKGRDGDKFTLYDRTANGPYRAMRTHDEVRWILTDAPVPHEAAEEGMEYEEYLSFFLDACDQPWEQVKEAQAHLIAAFNRGTTMRITNDDGTDVSFSIAGQQFANSVIARNLPGSEIFSGPVKDSVNGVVVAKGRFGTSVKGKSHEAEDITLRIENGRVMEADARVGGDEFRALLAREDSLDPSHPRFEGSRHFGEIGIGTNPFIRRHLRSTLLCEKIGGSFHLALGDCYGDRYLGEECKMSNGNESDVHWDLTTMLRGKGGRMYLDGQLVQKDGEWIDCPALGIDAAKLDVLNRGWEAIPEAQRPKYWRDKIAAQDQAVTR